MPISSDHKGSKLSILSLLTHTLLVATLLFFSITSPLCTIFLAVGLLIAPTALKKIHPLPKQKYYQMNNGNRSVTLHERVFRQFFAICLKKHSETVSIKQFFLTKDEAHLLISFENIPKENRNSLVETVEKDLKEQLASILGYKNKFHLNATFQGT